MKRFDAHAPLAALVLLLGVMVLSPATVRAEAVASQNTAAHHAAARALAAEQEYQLGNFARSAGGFREAARLLRNGPFADDAAFAAITAVEAAGDDEQAAQLWATWQREHPESPLAGEVGLARVWSDLRQGAVKEAGERLARLEAEYPWFAGDPRRHLAAAAVAFRSGHPEEGLALAQRAESGPVALFLRGLCLTALDRSFQAAVHFQELSERFPDSPLHGHALLAKANIFRQPEEYALAAGALARFAGSSTRLDLRQEAELLAAACTFLAGDAESGVTGARQVIQNHPGSEVAARARFLLGEMRWRQDRFEEAVVEFNRFLAESFDHDLAGSALYRTGRCLDALGRHAEANSTYQAVATGYPYAPEAPAAIYLAGVGLVEQGLPRAAAPYFQLILDRYRGHDEGQGTIVFTSSAHQELVEASLCLLEYCFHLSGDTGLLCGAPHLILQRMPPSPSRWRAYALLMDADALAAHSRYAEAQETLARLFREFPDHQVGIKANRLLAWTYARQGRQDLAIQTEERLLARYAAQDDHLNMSAAWLTRAHNLFNQKDYAQAAARYEEFLATFGAHDQGPLALYQLGICYLRLNRPGDAVDCWERIVDRDPATPLAARAWTRAGDLYFHTGHYDEARRCFEGLLAHFTGPDEVARGQLRLAQCDYNEGDDERAAERFREVRDRCGDSEIGREAAEGLAQAWYRLGQQEGGESYLNRLVAVLPTSGLAPEAQLDLGLRLYEQRDFDGAARKFQRVVTRFPGSSVADRAHFLMADSYSQLDSTGTASERWEEFLAYFPASDLVPAARFRLASAHFAAGEYRQAATGFTAVLEAATEDETRFAALLNLAMSYRILDRIDEAVRLLIGPTADEFTNGPEVTAIARLLGEIHEEAGEFDRAARVFQTALAREPPAALATELNYRLGHCREQAGDTAGALLAYGESIASAEKTNAFRLSAVARSAALQERQGDYRGALTAYRDLIANAADPELVLAARERASQLETAVQAAATTAMTSKERLDVH